MKAKNKALLLAILLILPLPIQAQSTQMPSYLKPKLYFFYNGSAPLKVEGIPEGCLYFAYNFTILNVSSNTISYREQEWIYNSSELVQYFDHYTIQSLSIGAGPWFILPNHMNDSESIGAVIMHLLKAHPSNIKYNITFDGENYTISFNSTAKMADSFCSSTGYIVLNEEGLMLEFYGRTVFKSNITCKAFTPPVIHIKLADTNYGKSEYTMSLLYFIISVIFVAIAIIIGFIKVGIKEVKKK